MGIDNENIVFANAAARSQLGAVSGRSLAQSLPQSVLELLEQPAEHFVAGTAIRGQEGTLSVQRLEGLTLLTFVSQQPQAETHPQLMRQMGDALFTLRMAIDGLLPEDDLEDSRQSTYASITYQSYYQLNRLYQHIFLLDALAGQALPRANRLVNVEEVCDQLYRTVEPLMRGSGIAITYHADNGNYDTLIHQTHLETLVLNLLANSLSHTPKGRSVELNLRLMGNRILLSVVDTGCGIREDAMADLFNGAPPVRTTDVKAGAGLGLPLVRGLVEHYGGAVMLESKPDKGTCVRVSLPIRLPKETAVHTPTMIYGDDDGMNTVMTEMSVVFGRELYTRALLE
jgi:signal transduction histidine kinase